MNEEKGVVGGGFGCFLGGCRVGAGVRKEPELQYSVHLSLHLTPGIQSRIGEQCNSAGWRSRWRCSAAPKTSSEIPPAPASRCFNGSPLSVLQPISRKAPPPSPISPHNYIRICPLDQVANVANAHRRGIHGAEGRPSAQLFLRFYGRVLRYTTLSISAVCKYYKLR